MTIELVDAAFTQGLAEVGLGVDRLRADRDRVTRQVEDLLSGDWHGAAADAFSDAFTDWRRGAGDVLDGLVAMGQLMGSARAALEHGDAGSAVRLQRISARIVDRLS